MSGPFYYLPQTGRSSYQGDYGPTQASSQSYCVGPQGSACGKYSEWSPPPTTRAESNPGTHHAAYQPYSTISCNSAQACYESYQTQAYSSSHASDEPYNSATYPSSQTCAANPTAAPRQSGDKSITDLVELNVGGTYYTVDKGTLSKVADSRLGHMFLGHSRPSQDAQGRYFIGRNGILFQYVLDYLRDETACLPQSDLQRAQLKKEAEFYQIDGLVDKLQSLEPSDASTQRPASPYQSSNQSTSTVNSMTQQTPEQSPSKPPASQADPAVKATGAGWWPVAAAAGAAGAGIAAKTVFSIGLHEMWESWTDDV